MCVLFIFYMYFVVIDNGFGIDKIIVMLIMLVYGLLIYMILILGGWIVDRIMGIRGVILLGVVFIIIGYICLSLLFVLIGLFILMFFIIIGLGLMKLNILNIVGCLYFENDRCMDVGFVIFYMLVNMGVLLLFIIL